MSLKSMIQNRILQVSKLAIYEGGLNCQRHSFKQEALNETRLEISDTQRIFFFYLQVVPNISNRSLPGHRREKRIHNCFTS